MKSLKVRDYMSTRLLTFNAKITVAEAVGKLLEHLISGAPVLDEEGNLLGILSEVDLIRVFLQDSYYNEAIGIASDFMQHPVESVDPNMDIVSLAEQFLSQHRRRYPVVKDGVLLGQISCRDVLRAAADFQDAE